MKILNTSPISGMQELLPVDQVIFNNYKDAIREVYRRHGFWEIETPIIDRTEILLAKAGGETEKQVYKVCKTDEDPARANEALRFDHTVPLARYIAEHESDLDFPFKVTQIGRNFRGERAQKGRFREFYQCDIDVLGRNILSLNYDAEIIVTLVEAIAKLIKDNCFIVRISNRKLLSGFIEERNLQDVSKDIFSIIDHAEKVTPEKTLSLLKSLNIDDDCVSELYKLMNISGCLESTMEQLNNFPCNSLLFNEGKHELYNVLSVTESLLNEMEICVGVIADLKIVRGLDYYTGTVFETSISDYPKIGSICSGGRYENLAGLYTDQKFPGVGGSIGLTRLFFAMNEYGIGLERATDIERKRYAVVPFNNDKKEIELAYEVAAKFRKRENDVDVIFINKKLGDKIRLAKKTADYLIVIGENEINMRSFKVKNLLTEEEVEEKI